jgi:3,4-dihydroxy 2-butanone 4-phosphate synthase/GTP cyclohydrolase II
MEDYYAKTGLPWVTLAYAQSLDGSIAAQRGAPLGLSGAASLEVTHRLRAQHHAILVGIGTLLADDPRLSVRLVPGDDPQPVVEHHRLRTPLDARLLTRLTPAESIARSSSSDWIQRSIFLAAWMMSHWGVRSGEVRSWSCHPPTKALA